MQSARIRAVETTTRSVGQVFRERQTPVCVLCYNQSCLFQLETCAAQAYRQRYIQSQVCSYPAANWQICKTGGALHRRSKTGTVGEVLQVYVCAGTAGETGVGVQRQARLYFSGGKKASPINDQPARRYDRGSTEINVPKRPDFLSYYGRPM